MTDDIIIVESNAIVVDGRYRTLRRDDPDRPPDATGWTILSHLSVGPPIGHSPQGSCGTSHALDDWLFRKKRDSTQMMPAEHGLAAALYWPFTPTGD
jgi:hypothetical protein